MINLTKTTVFDYKIHKENFIDYLEVIILKDGKIEYAVPSHQQKLIELYCEKYNTNYQELCKKIPLQESPEYWIIYNEGIISVWYDFILRPENITEAQQEALDNLKSEGCIYEKYKSYEVYKNIYGNLVRKETIKL